MSNNKLNIGFIGSGDWGAVFFDFLLRQNNVKFNRAILLNRDNNRIFANKSNVEVFLYKNKEDYNLLNDENLDAIFMAGWPFKIPVKVLQALNCDIYNIHASLLPKYRGPEPITQQLLHSEREGGVTIHKVSSSWDAGEICEQMNFNITNNDNNRTLFFKAGRVGIKLLSTFINKIIFNKVEYKMQNEELATYYKKIKPSDYIVNSNTSIHEITKYSKAFYGIYPIIYNLNGKFIAFSRWEFISTPCKDNLCLPIKEGFIKVLNFKEIEVPSI